ncbi:TIGR00725 family protein [Methanolacinia paynteri]|uniref:TIGR00725 family protein n=1 Tax=Methanolacinia paynteri TaxID=230356 RepID=UPI00064E9B5B|nr:TIGR00725 family protein [Methanolacinia paynteri]
MQIGVIGASECDKTLDSVAEETGRLIAKSGAVLVCGGRGGVMESACRGANGEGGMTLGILPDSSSGNLYLGAVVKSNLGIARNALVVGSSDAVIAVGGSYGTLSEIAMALKMEIPVFGLETWDIPGVEMCKTPDEAVSKAVLAAENRM